MKNTIKIILIGLFAFAVPLNAADRPALNTETLDALNQLETLKPEKLQKLEGKVVVVTFFATWCPPCRVEFKHLEKLHHAYKDKGLAIVAINRFEDLDGLSSPAKLKRYLKRTKPSFSVVRGDEKVNKLFGDVQRIPTLFIFNRKGDLSLRFVHKYKAEKQLLEYDEMVTAIAKIL